MGDVLDLSNFRETTAFYIFCDLRGFTAWSQKHQSEIKKLTTILYSLATKVFGERKDTTLLHRVVKFLGDGFFAVNEYDDEETESFLKGLLVTCESIFSFITAFNQGIRQSNLHDKGDIKVSFGLSYGASFRFNNPGHPVDFIGNKINLAARLCSVAKNSEVVAEYELKEHIKATQIGNRENIQYFDDRIVLRSIGDSVVCRIKDKNAFIYEYQDMRHLSALVDLIKKANK